MKKNIFFILCLIFISSIDFTYAVTYKSNFELEVRERENTQANINKAKLIKKYALNYKKEIKNLLKIYQIPTSPLLSRSMKEIDIMIDSLNKIEVKNIEKTDADKIISSVIFWLKKINQKLTPYLKDGQLSFQKSLKKRKARYIKIGNILSKSLENFIQKLSLALTKKKKLTPSNKEVVRSLVRLDKTVDKIKEFQKIDFKTKQDMKNYYIKIIKSIRREIKIIKNLLK